MSKLYRVECTCPTPLAANPAEIIAHNEADALRRFKNRNHIVDTDHPIKVNEVRDASAEEDSELEPDATAESESQPGVTPRRKRPTKKPAVSSTAAAETGEQQPGENKAAE